MDLIYADVSSGLCGFGKATEFDLVVGGIISVELGLRFIQNNIYNIAYFLSTMGTEGSAFSPTPCCRPLGQFLGHRIGKKLSEMWSRVVQLPLWIPSHC